MEIPKGRDVDQTTGVYPSNQAKIGTSWKYLDKTPSTNTHKAELKGKIGNFLKGALEGLKRAGGAALIAAGVPVFMVLVLPAMGIGAAVGAKRPQKTEDYTDTNRYADAGAGQGLVVAMALVRIGYDIAKTGKLDKEGYL